MHTPDKLDISRIRTLLAGYYDGTTTSAEERELSDRLSVASPGELPPELRAEQRMFAALKQLQNRRDDISVMPEHIERRINRSIDEMTHPQRPRLRLTAWTSVAAAAAAVFAIILFRPSGDNSGTPSLTAGHTPSTELIADTSLIEHPSVDAARLQRALDDARNNGDLKLNVANSSNITICTNPEQAKAVTDKVNKLLDHNLRRSSDTKEKPPCLPGECPSTEPASATDAG